MSIQNILVPNNLTLYGNFIPNEGTLPVDSLVPGTNGQILETVGSTVEWVTPAVPQTINNLVLDTVSGGYNVFKVVSSNEATYLTTNNASSTYFTAGTTSITSTGNMTLTTSGQFTIIGLPNSPSTNILTYDAGQIGYSAIPTSIGASLTLTANITLTSGNINTNIMLPGTTTYASGSACYNTGLVNVSTGVITPPSSGIYCVTLDLTLIDNGASTSNSYQLFIGLYNITTSTPVNQNNYLVSQANYNTYTMSFFGSLSSSNTYSFYFNYQNQPATVNATGSGGTQPWTSTRISIQRVF